MAKDYAERAKWCLKEAESALLGDNPAICVRRSQEALELAAKSVLRYLAVEYPREHDVSDALKEVEKKLPPYLASELQDMTYTLAELARLRGPAFYGYEREGIPASRAFGKEYAKSTFKKVKHLMKLCLVF
jgi:HEPN domain-containing protein